jgi:putative ABC transport system substrate-binding protein
MTDPYRRLGFSLLLLSAVAGLLLWSDRHSRQGQASAAAQIPIALLTHSSNPLLDETRLGILDGLAAHGFRDGGKIALTTFNPEGDLATGNLMAQKIASGGYRLAVSVSTVMLQALANANRDGRVPHVFGAVTSPVAAGVGIKSLESLDKPRHLTGIATPQPVADIFKLAKRINPALKTVGVVWNPGEVNSEVCTKLARQASAELGITLLEAPVEQTKDVREAAESLAGRGVQAFWTGGDVTVNNAVDSLIGVAQAAHVPVFSNIAGHALRGGLFDLGADYHEVGMEIGRIAGDLLAGGDPARLPVRAFIPRRIVLNEKTRLALPPGWRFDPDLKAQAAQFVAADGTTTTAATARPNAPLDHPWKLKRLLYVESPPAEEVVRGFDEGLKAAGLQAGRDFVLSEASAQGDMATLPTLADAAASDGTELLVTLSTPTLQAALRRVKQIPLVFTFVADPVLAGAGRDNSHHLPNVTGVYTLGPYTEMADLLARYFPRWKKVGTLFSPAEDNSVRNKDLFTQELARRGIEVQVVPVNSPGELPDAALALAAKSIDAIVQVPDNQSASGFAAIAQAAARAGKPLFAFTESGVEQGAALGYTLDYHQAGYDAALKAAQVMRGKAPGDIPFSRPSRIKLVVSVGHAQAVGLELPPELVAKADRSLSP